MLNTLKAQPLRLASADVPVRRFSTWLDSQPGTPDEHHHSHPRYRGLHLVTPGKLYAAAERSAGEINMLSMVSTMRRLLSSFWVSEVTPRRVRRSARA